MSSVSEEEHKKLLTRVEELENALAGKSGSQDTKMIVPQSRLLEFPNKPGMEARCWIEQTEARFAQGSFATMESKIGAIKTAMAKHITALTWLDMLPSEALSSWENFRKAYDFRYEVTRDLFAKCDLWSNCKQDKSMSVREFLDQVLHATKFFFDNMRPPEAPTTGTDKNTLKWANRGYDMAVSQVKYAIFVNGLRPEIRNELRKTKIDPADLAKVDTKRDTDFIITSENLFKDLFNKAIGIEESIKGGFGLSFAQAPVETKPEPAESFETAVMGFNRGRGRSNTWQRRPQGGRPPLTSGFNRGRGSNNAWSTPPSPTTQCFRCFGFNHFARQCPNPPERIQTPRGRGTPWQTRRPLTVISESEKDDSENRSEFKPLPDQEQRFEEIGTLDANPDFYGDVLSSQMTSAIKQSN